MSLAEYYDESYPPSILGYSSGATAGIPGTWQPAGGIVPKSPAELAQGYPLKVTASPATAWTTGQYVQTATAGIPGRATWTGTNWVSGAAPLAEDETPPPPEPPPPEPEPESQPETFTATPIAPEDMPDTSEGT